MPLEEIAELIQVGGAVGSIKPWNRVPLFENFHHLLCGLKKRSKDFVFSSDL
jgi:hypothetical protein